MKLFIVHVYLGCCANNSDGKIWVSADNQETAKIIVKQHTKQPITKVEEFNLENEIIYSSCNLDSKYQLKYQTDNWGYLPEEYVKENNMSKTYSEAWQLSHQW